MNLDKILNIRLGDFSVEGIFSALLALAFCLVVIRLVSKLLKKALSRTRIDERIRSYIIRGTKVLLYCLTSIIVIGALGVKVTSLVALLSVCGLALSLALQDMLSNVAGGLLILTTKPFAVGDFIEAGGISGTVVEVALNCTRLDTFDGRRILLPNKALSGNQLVNYSTLGRRRIEHRVHISYDVPLATVTDALLRAVAKTADVLPDPAPSAQVESYGESAIVYSLRCWAQTEKYWAVYYALLTDLKGVLDEAGAEMSYNHINVHMKP